VVVKVEDDGRGIDPRQVAEALARRGDSSALEATDEGLLDAIFMPGVTTRDSVGGVSGRGVGLDVVRSNLRRIGGDVTVSSRTGQGTTFTLELPVAISLLRVLSFAGTNGRFAFASQKVVRIVASSETRIERAGAVTMVRLDDLTLPLFHASDLFDEGAGTDETIAIVETGDQLVAWAVPGELHEHEVMLHSTSPWLSGLVLVRAVGVSTEGELVALLDPDVAVGLARRPTARTSPPTAAPSSRQTSPRVLVVDDSEIMRDRVAGILRTAGFDVEEAVNGRDALARAERKRPDLVLTDLQMPVMDGFELLSTARRKFDDLPLVVLSSLGSEGDRERAALCGADAHLVKSELGRETLLSVIERFVPTGVRA
jgi:two-component system sensor histidine kinase and response regulator WspE